VVLINQRHDGTSVLKAKLIATGDDKLIERTCVTVAKQSSRSKNTL
jgi:hypothetical protein